MMIIIILLVVVATLAMVSLTTIMANIRNTLRVVGWGVAATVVTVRNTVVAAWPRIRLGLIIIAISVVVLLSIGLSIHQPFPVALAGVIFWLSAMVFFTFADVVAIVVGAFARGTGRALGIMFAILGALIAKMGLSVNLPASSEPATTAGPNFRARLERVKLRTYVVIFLVTALLTVFPYWSVAMVLLPGLAMLTLAVVYIKTYRGYTGELFWRSAIVLACVLAVGFTARFVFPETGRAINARLGDGDQAVACAVFKGTDACQAAEKRALLDELEEVAATGAGLD